MRANDCFRRSEHVAYLLLVSTPVAPPSPIRCDVSQYRRKPPHTTHLRDFPERVTITRPHHPFEGQSLEVLRYARMSYGLQFVLVLPDGSKSLVPADWTDFKNPSSPQGSQLIGSLDDLLRLRGLTGNRRLAPCRRGNPKSSRVDLVQTCDGHARLRYLLRGLYQPLVGTSVNRPNNTRIRSMSIRQNDLRTRELTTASRKRRRITKPPINAGVR